MATASFELCDFKSVSLQRCETNKPPAMRVCIEGYYVSTVGLNESTIKKYIQEQEKHDIVLDKLSVKEYENPLRDNGK